MAMVMIMAIALNIIAILIATATITTVMGILMDINNLAVTGMIIVDHGVDPAVGDERIGRAVGLFFKRYKSHSKSFRPIAHRSSLLKKLSFCD
jgi:hypothetical protein